MVWDWLRGGKKKEEEKKKQLVAYAIRRDMATEEIKLSIAKISNKHKIHAATSNPMNRPVIQVEIEEGFWKAVLKHRKEVMEWYEKSKYYRTILNDTLDAVEQRLELTSHPDLDQMNIHFSKGPGDVERGVTSIFE